VSLVLDVTGGIIAEWTGARGNSDAGGRESVHITIDTITPQAYFIPASLGCFFRWRTSSYMSLILFS
jgi:hypothetical protein